MLNHTQDIRPMKKLILCSLLIISGNVYAQSDSDLLKRFNSLDSMVEEVSENHPEQVMSFLNEELQIANTLRNDSLQFVARQSKVKVLSILGMFDQSLQLAYTLLHELEQRKNDTRTGDVLYEIGSRYFQMDDHIKSLDYYQRSKQAFIQSKRYDDTIRVNFEIGLALVGTGKSAEGFAILQHDLEVAKQRNDEDLIIVGIDNISNCYYEIDDYEKSLLYQKELLRYPYVNNTLNGKAAVNQRMAELYVALKQWDKAQECVTHAIQYATEMGSNDWLFDCYKNQAAIYEATGKYKDALHFHQLYLELKDSVYKQNYDSKMSAMANLYELDHKENTIRELETVQLLNQAKIQRLYLVIAVLILLVLLVVLYINDRKNKLEKALRQQFSKQLIQSQEEERFRISKELHDSVGQNILFIKNQIQKSAVETNPRLMQSVDIALEEVRNISKNLYPNQLEQYGLSSAVDGLCDKIKESTNLFVSSDFQLPDEKLSKETKINCYRIIQECVNNTLKHAKATAIRITGELTGNQIRLIVQDNGSGFEKSQLHINANRSFGLLNLEERVRILHGKFELETAPGKGTKSLFLIPVY